MSCQHICCFSVICHHSDSVNTDMLFKQARYVHTYILLALLKLMCYAFYRATYLAGELLCSVKDMIQFTAVLCQIYKGDIDDK